MLVMGKSEGSCVCRIFNDRAPWLSNGTQDMSENKLMIVQLLSSSFRGEMINDSVLLSASYRPADPPP